MYGREWGEGRGSAFIFFPPPHTHISPHFITFQDLDDIDTYDSSVVNCLQDYSAEIKSEQCKAQVNKYVMLAAQVRGLG